MTHVINIANFKGGVGKTTTTVMLSLLLSKKDKRVLFVDFDPQGNGTDLLYYKTFKNDAPKKSIFTALQEEDLSVAIHKLTDTLDIIPAEKDLRYFPRLLNVRFGNDFKLYGYLLDALLRPIKKNYDYIFIDVPPTISDFTDNALVAADHIAIVMQTQEFSLGAAEEFLPYINELVKTLDIDINLIAAIPVLMRSGAKTDKFILEEARKLFGEKMTKNPIKIRERVKMWGITGIKNEDRHDKAVFNMYGELADEIFNRIKKTNE